MPTVRTHTLVVMLSIERYVDTEVCDVVNRVRVMTPISCCDVTWIVYMLPYILDVVSYIVAVMSYVQKCNDITS